MTQGAHRPALRRIAVKNFLSLERVSVDLRPVNVLVGPNGAGKSNFLRIFGFLGDSARLDLGPAVDNAGGFNALRFRGRTGDIQIAVQATVSEFSSLRAPDEYTLDISERNVVDLNKEFLGYTALLREERFSFKRTPRQGRRITIDGSDVTIQDKESRRTVRSQGASLNEQSLGLATLPRLSEDAGGSAIRALADLFSNFRVFDINVGRARQPAAPSDQLADDASNLASFLHVLCRDDDVYSQINDDARRLITNFEELVFRPIGGSDEAIAVGYNERGIAGTTPLSQASYGTVQALALLALLYDPNPPLLTCIEEFDHGMHPYAFDVLVDRMREASQRTQFVLTTHSPALVNRLNPDELIVVERDPDTGASIMPAISSTDVAAIEEATEHEYGLGELWFSGSLGGVPVE